ncbi:MAG: hypothetical protein MAG794_00118 [Gammaproteobacteria bacterium]|nr:hypothetical protein [Gammaproteobacteria bacterium]
MAIRPRSSAISPEASESAPADSDCADSSSVAWTILKTSSCSGSGSAVLSVAAVSGSDSAVLSVAAVSVSAALSVGGVVAPLSTVTSSVMATEAVSPAILTSSPAAASVVLYDCHSSN